MQTQSEDNTRTNERIYELVDSEEYEDSKPEDVEDERMWQLDPN